MKRFLVAAMVLLNAIETRTAENRVGGDPTGNGGPTQLQDFKINTAISVDGVRYPYTAAGLNRAIKEAISGGGGLVDARGMAGTFTFTSEVEVGSTAGKPITLLLSPAANIGCNIKDSSSYCFRVFNNGYLIGGWSPGTGQGTSIGAISASTNMRGIIGTDDSLGGITNTAHIEGIFVSNINGGVLADAAMVIRGTKDNTVVRNCDVVNPFGVGLHIGGTTEKASVGELTIEDVWVNGSNGGTTNTTAQPVLIDGNTLSGNSSSIRFISGSIVAPGRGFNNVAIDGGGVFAVAVVSFIGTHFEGSINPAETTTPGISVRNSASNLMIVGGEYLFSYGTAFTLSISANSNNVSVYNMRTNHYNQVQNTVAGVNQVSTANQSIVRYESEPNFSNSQATFTAPPGITPAVFVQGTGANVQLNSLGGGFTRVTVPETSNTNTTTLPVPNFNVQLAVTPGMAISPSAPSISSGFGTSPCIGGASNGSKCTGMANGTASFVVNVGTGGISSNGVLMMPEAANGWNCFVTDITHPSTNNTRESASTPTTVTLNNYSNSGVMVPWPASDVLVLSCFAR
jgi:hypothetical protein